MTFTLTTPGGSQFEIDPTKVEAFQVEIDGVRYEISITKID